MDPKLIQSSRMVKIAGVGLLLMSIIALTEAIVSVATLDASANISELVFSIFYSIGLVVAGVAAIKSGISGTYLPARIMFWTILACLITYVVAFIVSLMLMIVGEKDLTPSVCKIIYVEKECNNAIDLVIDNWLQVSVAFFIAGLVSCGVCLFIAYRQLSLTKDADGLMSV